MTVATMTETGTVDTPSASSSDIESAIDWVRTLGRVGTWRTLTRRPWAHTVELNYNDSQAYLKVLPPSLRAAVNSSTLLAQHVGDAIPEVLATEPRHGWLLMADHGGVALSRRASEDERNKLLGVYADVQARVSRSIDVLDSLPTLAIDQQIAQLQAFLDPTGPLPAIEGARVHADEFLSRSRCRDYAGLIESRAALLEAYIMRARSLPATVSHGDLRPANAARKSDGSIIVFDWEEASAGPAGMSLHALFSGCATLIAILEDDTGFDPESLRQPRRELMHYLHTLASAGYSNLENLKHCVGAAALAGMVHYLIGFSRFPKDSDHYRSTVRSNLKKRISDLLDVADMLVVREPESASRLASNYLSHKRGKRAEKLLARHLDRQPDNADAALMLGQHLVARGRYRKALDVLSNANEVRPLHARTVSAMAEACRGLGDYRRSVRYFRRALSVLPASDLTGRSTLDSALVRTYELARLQRDAVKPGVVPELRYSQSERTECKADMPTLELGNALFRRHGVLTLRSVFDPGLLALCHDAFVERYHAYLANKRHKDALRIGDKRFQVTIDIKPPYDEPALIANPLIVPLMYRLLGQSCILGCFTSAMSLPGSLDQRLHKDHKALFEADPDASTTPSFAVTLMVPLVALDERVGTTRVKKGSHRLTSRESAELPWQTPMLELGDAYLMDYRLSHHGQANRSSEPRPILSLVYQRPWFRDYINFHQQPSLRIGSAHFQTLPQPLKALLSWTQHPLPLS